MGFGNFIGVKKLTKIESNGNEQLRQTSLRTDTL